MNWNIDYRGRVDAMEAALREQLGQHDTPAPVIDATVTLLLAMAEGSRMVTVRATFVGGGPASGRGSLTVLVDP